MIKLRSLAAIAIMPLMFAGCAAKLGTSPKGLEVPIEKAAVRLSADMKDGGYKIVTTDELKKWLDEGKKMTIISALSHAEDRVSGIIPGALSAPMPESEQEITPEDNEHLRSAAGNNKEAVLVVYCGFVASRKSHIGAKLLVNYGYKKVYRYTAGAIGWGESGYSLKK
jgi:thiosulfate/3-mercaptopyruvate sulfurtransferase